MTEQLAHIHMLGGLLLDHAREHSGNYPTSHFALLTTAVNPDIRCYEDPKTHLRLDWVYFSGHRLDDPELTVLMFAPCTHQPKRGPVRVVAFCDGSAQIMRETKFQKLLAAQIPGYDPGIAH